jgi:ferredoxin
MIAEGDRVVMQYGARFTTHVLTAPEVFDQDDKDGVGLLLTEFPEPGLFGKVREAVAVRPAAAIEISE